MNIEIKTLEAKLTNVNLGTEGSEENPGRRSDLDFDCIAEGATIGTLAGTDNVKAFWDDEGNIRLLGVNNITSKAELHECDMKFGSLVIEGCKAKKFSFKPINGRQIKMHVQVQVHHTDEQLLAIDKMQKKTDVLALTTKQGDLFE